MKQQQNLATHLQRRRVRVLHALVNAHKLLSSLLGNLDKLPQVADSAGVEVVQHNQVTALVYVTLESNLLLLGSVGLSPQPVLDIDAPVVPGQLGR